MKNNLVLPTDACPNCGERDVDRLIWDDEVVTCATCGVVYDVNSTITIRCHLCGETFTAEVFQEDMDGYTLNDDGTYNGAEVDHCCLDCAYKDEWEITRDWQYR